MHLARCARGLLFLLSDPACAACELPLGPQQTLFCEACGDLLEPFPQVAPQRLPSACYHYGGPLAEAIRRLKYGGRPDLARPLGQLAARTGAAFAGRVDQVVPIPLHGSRLRSRGYNQAALLAAPLARALGVPLRVGPLRRIRPTLPQAGLELSQRVDNVRGAFVARQLRGRVLLVDDVKTSGATLAEAAAALGAAGATAIHPFALGQVE